MINLQLCCRPAPLSPCTPKTPLPVNDAGANKCTLLEGVRITGSAISVASDQHRKMKKLPLSPSLSKVNQLYTKVANKLDSMNRKGGVEPEIANFMGSTKQ